MLLDTLPRPGVGDDPVFDARRRDTVNPTRSTLPGEPRQARDYPAPERDLRAHVETDEVSGPKPAPGRHLKLDREIAD